VVAEADAVHEAGVDVGGEKVGHGLDAGLAIKKPTQKNPKKTT
jgi:hypothetical protein